MGDFDDLDYDILYDCFCPKCGHSPIHSRDCTALFCDEGYIDESEDDPINCTPGNEFTMCKECKGTGFQQWCPSCGQDVSGLINPETNKPDVSITIYQADWIPGFAAYLHNYSLERPGKAHVVLNLGSLLSCVAAGDLERDELPYIVAECIMHEVIHVLEAWAGKEFSEERVEALIEKYRAKYPPVEE